MDLKIGPRDWRPLLKMRLNRPTQTSGVHFDTLLRCSQDSLFRILNGSTAIDQNSDDDDGLESVKHVE